MWKVIRTVWLAAVVSGAMVVATHAQGESDEAEESGELLRKFEPYVSLLGHVAAFDDEAEIQDNTSWIGLKFATGDDVEFFAHVEFGLNLIGGVEPFRAGGRTDSGLLTGDRLDDPAALGSRLGYLGVDFGSAGRVAIGKDNGQHYAIASYTTDRWNAFGGQGSLAYPGFGDGGASGTGRADQVLNYRVTPADRVDIGAQLQFSNSVNDELVDGTSASPAATSTTRRRWTCRCSTPTSGSSTSYSGATGRSRRTSGSTLSFASRIRYSSTVSRAPAPECWTSTTRRAGTRVIILEEYEKLHEN